jgi:hypothetical protein
MRRLRFATSLFALLLGTAALPEGVALAQMGFGRPGGGGGMQPGGFGGPSPGSSKKKPQVPPGQETHAAPNADELQKLQTQEPSIPPNPLLIPPTVGKRIGTDFQAEPETGVGTRIDRTFLPPYFSERSGSYRFRTVFPVWAERTEPQDRATSLLGLYYGRRSTEHDADVVFPLFWKLRDGETHTIVVAPFMHREGNAYTRQTPSGPELVPGRHDNWLAPLVFEGATSDGGGYFHVPPLITFTQHTSHSGFDLAGPGFCTWKGGSTCDPRTADEIDMGLAPLYFYGHDENTEYELIPPLLHYYKFNDAGDRSFNLWGPVLLEHSRESDVFNVMPVYWHNWGKNEDHVTVFPFFHYGYKGTQNLLITPLFLKSTGEKGDTTFATYVYARYRGRTQLDMISPLYWHYTDPDIDLDRKVVVPFYYRNTSPRGDDLALLPFYGHFQRPGISDTHFYSPLVRTTTDLLGWETDIFPVVYAGRQGPSSHLIVAPLLFDFSSAHSRTTLALPAYFRMADDASLTQVALNTFYREKKVVGGTEWEFHFFPLFSYGQSPTGHWWNLLYGLAGYTHEGTAATMRALYLPIPLSE